jgi:single-strand DNA-binding protein
MLNHVHLIGRLGQDPEARVSANGTMIVKLNLATDGPNNHTDWHRVTVFKNQAQACQQFLHKGAMIAVEGRIQYSKWTDKNTGEVKYGTEIIANRVVFLQTQPKVAAAQAPPPSAFTAADVPFA